MADRAWTVASLLLIAFSGLNCRADEVTFGGAGFACFNSAAPLACTMGGIPAGTAANIWNTGDYWNQTFTGTSLTSINQLAINFSLFDNLANLQQELISITVNGFFVGSLGEIGDGTTHNPLLFSQTYNTFGTISGMGSGGTSYDITFTVESPGVPEGNGTLGLITGNGQSTAVLSSVPEPATGGATILSLLVISMMLRRRAKRLD